MADSHDEQKAIQTLELPAEIQPKNNYAAQTGNKKAPTFP